MLGYLKGILAEKQEGYIIVDVNGVGYELFVSNNTLTSLPYVGQECIVYCYLQVKEDGICLFGFGTKQEKDVFNKLISVSGVGPKGAVTLLSGMSLTDLCISIANENTTALSKIKGLGKKTAERICLELKDKIGFADMYIDQQNPVDADLLDDATQVLTSLGINKSEAARLIKQVAKPDMTTEDIISLALKNMGR